MKAADFFTNVLVPFLPKFLADYFYDLGIWDLNSGQSQYGYIGSRFTNVLGSDSKLVFSPVGWVMGAGVRGPITDLLMGLGDDVTFCYGASIRATYGGPWAEITRAPQVRKTGSRLEKSNWLPLLAPNAALSWTEQLQNVFELEDPKGGESSERISSDDEKYARRAAILFGAILATATAIMEMWIRYGYGSYNESTGHLDLQNDPSERLRNLEYTHRLIPRRLMAIIYHIEVAGTLTELGICATQNFKSLGLKLLKILFLPVTAAQYAYRACAQKGKKLVGALLAVLVLALFILVVVLIILGTI